MLTRFLLATGASALVAASTANGFFLVVRPLWVAVLPAIIAALVVRRAGEAALSCAAGVALGVAVAPMALAEAAAGRWALLLATGAAAAAGAALAFVFALARRSVGHRATGPLVVLALGFTAATMAWTARTVANGPLSGTPPLAQALRIEPSPGSYWSDESIYSRVMHLTADGGNYYSSVRIAWNQKSQARGDPEGVFSFRMPTLFWMVSLLPGGTASLIPAMLVFGTLAVVSAYGLASRVVHPAFALVGSSLVAVYYTRVASSSHLLQADPWGAALALAGAAAWASALIAETARERNGWTWTAAALCLAGTLFREHVVFVPLAAWVASVSFTEERARKAWLPWSLCLAAFGVALSAHAVAASMHTTSAALPMTRWFEPGTRHLVAAIGFCQQLLGGQPWLPWLLVALALAGAAATRPAPLRWFLLVACTAPLVAFLFVRPPGALPGGGQPGYWGAAVVPLLWATVPLVFRTGARR